ncbi:PIN domain-containing protein, partial [Moraxella sp.]
MLNALLSICEWVRIFYLWRPNLKDEGDNHLIELAVAGNANIIV